MIKIPPILVKQFIAPIEQRCIPHGHHAYYVEWLRLYLDLCHHYDYNQHDKDSLLPFIEKLKKKQAEHIRKQAQHAVTLFLGVCRTMPFIPSSVLFSENQCSQVSIDSDINYMAVLDFLKKCLDLRKNVY